MNDQIRTVKIEQAGGSWEYELAVQDLEYMDTPEFYDSPSEESITGRLIHHFRGMRRSYRLDYRQSLEPTVFFNAFNSVIDSLAVNQDRYFWFYPDATESDRFQVIIRNLDFQIQYRKTIGIFTPILDLVELNYHSQNAIQAGTATGVFNFSGTAAAGRIQTLEVVGGSSSLGSVEKYLNVQFVAEAFFTGTANADFQISLFHINFPDTDVENIQILNGDGSPDIVAKIVSAVNAISGLSYSGINVGAGGIEFEWKTPGRLLSHSIAIVNDGGSWNNGFGVQVDPEIPEFENPGL